MGGFSKDLQKIVSPKFDENLLTEILQEIFNLNYVVMTDIAYNCQTTKGDSYSSIVTRFTVKATGEEKNGRTKEIVFPAISKALPTNIARRKTFRSLDFFNNEVNFYNKTWNAMNEFQKSKVSGGVFNNIPLCISGFADGTNDYVILEDLSFKGYGSITRCSSLDLNHAQLIMRLFAKFHALGLAFKDQQPKKFEEAANSLEETYFSEKHRKWYIKFQTRSLYGAARDAVSKQLPVSYVDKLDELFKNDFFGMLVHHCETRGPLAVITHGDAWIPNFLLKYDENKVPLSAYMIDFQLARCASLAFDITLFLYTCTEHSLRLKYWDDLIEDYHKTFVQTLVQLGSSPQLLTLDNLKAEIKRNAVFGIGMSMEAIALSLLEDDEAADLDMIQGDEEVPLELVCVINPFKSEEKRQRMADAFKHAIDNGFI